MFNNEARIEEIWGWLDSDGCERLATIIRQASSVLDNKHGFHFFTPNDAEQQAGVLHQPAGYEVRRHVHVQRDRLIRNVPEVLLILEGRLRLDFYTSDRKLQETREVGPGDVVILQGGGHGGVVLENCKIFEVRQGPYLGPEDKVRF